MKRLLIFGLLLLTFLSIGCADQKSATNSSIVETGDVIKIDYIGTLDNGSVFDTSLKDVAQKEGIYQPQRTYQPLQFKTGAGRMIKGFDEGVIGMKVGETKEITVPPEDGYGLISKEKVREIDIEEEIPIKENVPKIFTATTSQFNLQFGQDHKTGDIVEIPGLNLTATIIELNNNTVNLSWNLKKGDTITTPQAPWPEEVAAIDDTNITLKHVVKPGDTIEFPGTPWNSTVIAINDKNMTIRHNKIPDTTINSITGPTRIHFTEDKIIMDSNHQLAGKTLHFKVTVREIVSKAGTEENSKPGTGLPPAGHGLPITE